jgi:hypothetical protein
MPIRSQDYAFLYGAAVLRPELAAQQQAAARERDAMSAAGGYQALANSYAARPKNLTVAPWSCATCGKTGYVLHCAECRVGVHGEWGV